MTTRRKNSNIVTKKELAAINKRLNAKYGWENPWRRGLFLGKRQPQPAL